MKKKTIRRSLSLLCSLALMFSLAIPAFAAASNNTFITEDGTVVQMGVPGNGATPRAVTLINEVGATAKEYEKSFGCSPVNGSDMKLTFENTGSCTIYFTLVFDEHTFETVEIVPGSTPYIIDFNNPNGLRSSGKVMLSSRSQQVMTFNLSLTQYW